MKLKIPYFRQEKNTTCGVASVRMVLASHGKNISEFELEDACETGWLGNTCREIVSGIKKLGFEAEEVDHVTIKYLLAQLKKNRPLIALIDLLFYMAGLRDLDILSL